MQSPTTERRESTRTKPISQDEVSIRLSTESPTARPLVGTVRDISETGIGIQVDAPLQVGSTVFLTGSIRSGLCSKKLNAAAARVVYCNPNGEGCLIGLALNPNGDRFGQQRKTTAPVEEIPSDYYDILQLSPKADPDTIHRVYRILAQRYHPDNRETGDDEQFRALLDAYRVLSDPEKRAAYDATLGQTRQLRWRIFDQPAAAQGHEGEKRKRSGVLSLLYTKRANQPSQPAMTIIEMEELLGCPREHLEFTLWYLREASCITRGDNGRYTITAKGVDTLESDALPSVHTSRLLPAGK